MRICFFGAGAVGGYFGGKLAKAGEDVSFIARGLHLDAMREGGLRVESVDGDFTVHPVATSEPSEIGVVDLVVLAVKSHDTSLALEQMAPLVGEDTSILTLQNGVENEDLIGDAYGMERVVGGVAYIGTEVMGPGHIRHSALGRVTLGDWPTGTSDRTRGIGERFKGAGIPVKLTDDIAGAKWRKLVWNAAFNPISILVPIESAELARRPETRDVLASIMREVVEVASAAGHPIEGEIVERSIEMTLETRGVRTSMLQDFEKGRALELDALLGVVVRYGKRLGVGTPVSSTVLALTGAKRDMKIGDRG